MIVTTECTFPSRNGRDSRGHLARPASPGPFPGVLIFQELYGLNDDIRRIAARFAEAGYVAFAPDLFDWARPRPLCVARTMWALTRGQGPALEHIDHARRWLAAREEVDAGRIGVAGFCMGGGFAVLYAAQASVQAAVQVAAPFYGQVPKERDRLAGICPVFAGYGERDGPTARQGRRLEQFLTELDVPHEVRFYPEAGHSYMNHSGWGWANRLINRTPFQIGYQEEAAEDSWTRMLAFFGQHLSGAAG